MRALIFAFLLGVPAVVQADVAVPLSTRGLKICVSADAPQPVKEAANQVLAAVATQPLLAVMRGSTSPVGVTDTAALLQGPLPARAYNHLIVVGLPNDPMIQAVWQRQALVSEPGIYVFGFGNLQGDIGYLESDRNPFLHSAGIKSTPFETEIVVLTGTTAQGVKNAVAAFLGEGLINGVVASPGWSRGAPTLLDRNPLPPAFSSPAIPRQVAGATCVGVTSADESEYRGALKAAGAKPLQIWRFKYYVPGAWDGAGASRSVPQYLAGLHRTSSDNSLWVGQFSSAAEAASATQQIGRGSGWKEQKGEWIGTPSLLPEISNQDPLARTVRLWSKGSFAFISTLPGLDSTTMP